MDVGYMVTEMFTAYESRPLPPADSGMRDSSSKPWTYCLSIIRWREDMGFKKKALVSVLTTTNIGIATPALAATQNIGPLDASTGVTVSPSAHSLARGADITESGKSGILIPTMPQTTKPPPPPEEPALPSEEPALPSEEPALPSEEPALPSEEPALPSEEPALPSEEPALPSEEPALSPEQPALPPEQGGL